MIQIIYDGSINELSPSEIKTLGTNTELKVREIMVTQNLEIELLCTSVESGSIVVTVRTPFICVCDPECQCGNNVNATLTAIAVASAISQGQFTAGGIPAASYITEVLNQTSTTGPIIVDFGAETSSISSSEAVYISLAATFGCLLLTAVAVMLILRRRSMRIDQKHTLEVPVPDFKSAASPRKAWQPIYRDPVPYEFDDTDQAGYLSLSTSRLTPGVGLQTPQYNGDFDDYVDFNASPTAIPHLRQHDLEPDDYLDLQQNGFRSPAAMRGRRTISPDRRILPARPHYYPPEGGYINDISMHQSPAHFYPYAAFDQYE